MDSPIHTKECYLDSHSLQVCSVCIKSPTEHGDGLASGAWGGWAIQYPRLPRGNVVPVVVVSGGCEHWRCPTGDLHCPTTQELAVLQSRSNSSSTGLARQEGFSDSVWIFIWVRDNNVMPCENVTASASERHQANWLHLFQRLVDICNHCRDDGLNAEKVLWKASVISNTFPWKCLKMHTAQYFWFFILSFVIKNTWTSS